MSATPRWLSQEEQETWQALVSVFIQVPSQLDRQLQRDAEISHFEYQVLASLSAAPALSLQMSALAERTEGSLPRLSQVVSRLEKRGWVKRSTDPNDGRCTIASLTPAGRDKIVAAAPGHVEEVRRLVVDPLTSTQAVQLRNICRRILDAVDTHNEA